MGWLEREMYLTGRSKFKVGDKSVTPGLIEFSGGINDGTTSSKEAHDIHKLYACLKKIMIDTNVDIIFAMRCYDNTSDHQIYFKKLVKYEDKLYRLIDVEAQIPNTPRKLVAYLKKIPDMIAWRQAVVNSVLQD
ncbi:hypothetical protein MBANPS3_008811 [Mucor bainieri]